MKTVLNLFLATLLSTSAMATQTTLETTEATGQQSNNQVVGVGIVIEEIDSSFMVRDVVPGGPAQKDGRLMHGDFIPEFDPIFPHYTVFSRRLLTARRIFS